MLETTGTRAGPFFTPSDEAKKRGCSAKVGAFLFGQSERFCVSSACALILTTDLNRGTIFMPLKRLVVYRYVPVRYTRM
jgi:hypothetical protein